MKIYHVNAFTNSVQGGNPAGVVLHADHLSESEMKAIAKTVGYSETAFIMDSDLADFKIRFFTPSDEVDLCGHATIASFTVLLQSAIIQAGVYSQETKAGILKVNVSSSGDIFMNQLTPTAYEILDKKAVADSLGLDDSLLLSLPQVYSTGLKDIMVHIKDLQAIESIQPDFDRITAISKAYHSTGYHVFTLETLGEATAHCRNFAPLYAIDEEAATGTASGAVSGYILEKGLIPMHDGKNTLIYEQGYEMQRPSEITAHLTVDDHVITEVTVGGKGIITAEKDY